MTEAQKRALSIARRDTGSHIVSDRLTETDIQTDRDRQTDRQEQTDRQKRKDGQCEGGRKI